MLLAMSRRWFDTHKRTNFCSFKDVLSNPFYCPVLQMLTLTGGQHIWVLVAATLIVFLRGDEIISMLEERSPRFRPVAASLKYLTMFLTVTFFWGVSMVCQRLTVLLNVQAVDSNIAFYTQTLGFVVMDSW